MHSQVPGSGRGPLGGVDGHYSAGHKETGEPAAFPGGQDHSHAALPRGWEAQPGPALHPYTTAAVCAWFVPSSDLADFWKKAALPVESALVPNKTASWSCFSESLKQGDVIIPRSAQVRAAPTDSGRTCLNPPALPRASALAYQAQWPASHSRWAPTSRSLPHCHAPSLYLVRPHVHTALPHFPRHGPWLGRDGRALCLGTGTVTSI